VFCEINDDDDDDDDDDNDELMKVLIAQNGLFLHCTVHREVLRTVEGDNGSGWNYSLRHGLLGLR